MHGFVLKHNGKLYGWGDGTYGELGDPDMVEVYAPRKIPYFDNKNINAKYVSCGLRHSCVVSSKGEIFTFGDNTEDQCAAKLP